MQSPINVDKEQCGTYKGYRKGYGEGNGQCYGQGYGSGYVRVRGSGVRVRVRLTVVWVYHI